MVLEVEYKVSLHKGNHEGRWNINKDKGYIVFNLPSLYDRTMGAIERWGKSDNYSKEFMEDMSINFFVGLLIEVELIERVCIERAHQKIRMKGRTRCKPVCCVEKLALMMARPDQWEDMREIYK